ncbi:uncharacterized protein LOC125811961 [Solanum verrucosum]|uniref:uncharacterized protein LOC125811961 n=1 Tax=Solanum verrucosum TaxID=315347 RepID=UPI0020D1015B|nr:uncharacterized protein LOC125811961 [Solanum verrucosum]
MADQKMEIDVDEKREIDLNKEFDPIEKIVSLERENDLLLRKVENLEATQKVEIEVKETEIRALKQKLEEQEKRWKNRQDFFAWRSMSWRKGRVKELLDKISELENKLKSMEDAISQKVVDENEQVGGSSRVKLED